MGLADVRVLRRVARKHGRHVLIETNWLRTNSISSERRAVHALAWHRVRQCTITTVLNCQEGSCLHAYHSTHSTWPVSCMGHKQVLVWQTWFQKAVTHEHGKAGVKPRRGKAAARGEGLAAAGSEVGRGRPAPTGSARSGSASSASGNEES